MKKKDIYNPLDNNFRRNEFPFYWIAKVNAKYTEEMERKLKKINLDISSWRILMTIHEDINPSIKKITAHSFLKPSTTTKIIYRMRRDGLIELYKPDFDRRLTLISLTKEGIDKLEATVELTKEIVHRSFKEISTVQVENLNKKLEDIFNNISSIIR